MPMHKTNEANEEPRSLMLDDSACTFELETTFDDNMGTYGNMFDIKTLGGEISIYGMDIYVDVTKTVQYEIYSKTNSFKDDDGKVSLQPWTLVKKGSVVGGGRRIGTPIRDFTVGNLTVTPNERRAFYVTLDSADLRYRNITGEMPDAVVGDLFVSNDDMEVFVGVSVAGFPLKADTPFFGKRVWSGRFYYRADRTCTPSASPSVVELPSIFPTPVPSRPFDTSSPSVVLSITPSIKTSQEPTVAFSLEPSIATSQIPTADVSFEPTEIAATLEPSDASSMDPTITLSIGPTEVDATFEPTVTVSMEPTTEYSIEPTGSALSVSPTLTPSTSTPTSEPSYFPSTVIPTSQPTASPSTEIPTLQPSSSPSTTIPSPLPSQSPSSSSPTYEPTSFPSSHKPSFQPSLVPSSATPTHKPTEENSEAPSTFFPTTLPSLEITAAPTRPEPDDWIFQINDVITTPLDGGTGAYGNMFTVTAKKKPIRITTLSLHTDFETGNITAFVYTKAGDFVGFENEPRAWRKISESTFRGAGRGFLSRIPFEDFESLYLYANDTVAIYVTMTTADMRYTRTNQTIGSAVASNDYIDINAGVGVADYPFASEFFLYSPRAFDGAVHYSAKTDRLPMMNISYSFYVHHPEDVFGRDLSRLIEYNVETTARSLIQTSPILIGYANDHQVRVDSARALQVPGSCKPIASKYLCTPVDATVCVTYLETLRAGELRFTWLKVYKNITKNVNLMFQSDYVGDMPMEDARIISLHAREEVKPMTNATQRAFEMAVLHYLEEKLSKKNVTILDVQVTAQNIKTDKDISIARFLQRDSDDEGQNPTGTTIDVSTNINGQYRPPPDIDYSATVEDSIDADPQDLEQSLKRTDRYFEIIESTSSEKDESTDSQSEIASGTPANTSTSNTLLIVFICLVVLFFIFVCGTWYWRRRHRRRNKFAGPSILRKSEFLKGKNGLFSGYSKKTYRDEFVTAEVTWAGSTENLKSNKSDSVPYKDNRYYDDPDSRVAEQFQDVGTYGYNSQSNPTWGDDTYRSEFSGADLGYEAQHDSFRSQFDDRDGPKVGH